MPMHVLETKGEGGQEGGITWKRMGVRQGRMKEALSDRGEAGTARTGDNRHARGAAKNEGSKRGTQGKKRR